MTHSPAAVMVSEALMAERAHTARLTRQLADTASEADTLAVHLDNLRCRLEQWCEDGGVVDVGLLAEVLEDDVLPAVAVVGVLRLRAVQA